MKIKMIIIVNKQKKQKKNKKNKKKTKKYPFFYLSENPFEITVKLTMSKLYNFDNIASDLITDILIDAQGYIKDKDNFARDKIKSYINAENQNDVPFIYEIIRDNVEYNLKIFHPMVVNLIKNCC